MSELIEQNEQSLSLTFNDSEIELIKEQCCRDATDEELRFFLYTASSRGLNPLNRQIHAVKRWDARQGKMVMSIQTGIDGYRLIANRTQGYAGSSDATYGPDHTKDGFPAPESATVTVKKIVSGHVCDFTATARWDEYVARKKDGTPNSFWKRMPYGQLAKCAESLALRKAFPEELGGLYTTEEMDQADNELIVVSFDDEPKTETLGIQPGEETDTTTRVPDTVVSTDTGSPPSVEAPAPSGGNPVVSQVEQDITNHFVGSDPEDQFEAMAETPAPDEGNEDQKKAMAAFKKISEVYDAAARSGMSEGAFFKSITMYKGKYKNSLSDLLNDIQFYKQKGWDIGGKLWAIFYKSKDMYGNQDWFPQD